MKNSKSILKLTLCSLIFWQLPALAGNNTIEQIIRKEATEKGIPEALVKAVITAESSNNPHAVSPKGAMGLIQLMPKTAQRFKVTDAFDPKQNIRAGVGYLSLLKKQFGTWPLALAAYNAGEHKVKKYGGIPPYKETRDYVVKILKKYNPELIPASLSNHKIKTRKAKQRIQQTNPKPPVDIYSTSLFFNVEL